MTQATKLRYRLQVGSGCELDALRPFRVEYMGIRMAAERFRWLFTRLMGAS
jgi:hypothetical protein